ncbi:hypothetical protein H4R34_005352 [Dimargaris verticillata]|uniref:RING-type domain-containing protein n=1 Tax=Dimargaris verticillata TaxID=2761393 RepID=A0A9W8B2F3_9FUNG|nr:hypothetical protein H4R34_005352 [Dimargaris verticillata]
MWRYLLVVLACLGLWVGGAQAGKGSIYVDTVLVDASSGDVGRNVTKEATVLNFEISRSNYNSKLWQKKDPIVFEGIIALVPGTKIPLPVAPLAALYDFTNKKISDVAADATAFNSSVSLLVAFDASRAEEQLGSLPSLFSNSQVVYLDYDMGKALRSQVTNIIASSSDSSEADAQSVQVPYIRLSIIHDSISGSSSNVAAIVVGSALGAFTLFIIVVILCCYRYRRQRMVRRRRRQQNRRQAMRERGINAVMASVVRGKNKPLPERKLKKFSLIEITPEKLVELEAQFHQLTVQGTRFSSSDDDSDDEKTTSKQVATDQRHRSRALSPSNSATTGASVQQAPRDDTNADEVFSPESLPPNSPRSTFDPTPNPSMPGGSASTSPSRWSRMTASMQAEDDSLPLFSKFMRASQHSSRVPSMYPGQVERRSLALPQEEAGSVPLSPLPVLTRTGRQTFILEIPDNDHGSKNGEPGTLAPNALAMASRPRARSSSMVRPRSSLCLPPTAHTKSSGQPRVLNMSLPDMVPSSRVDPIEPSAAAGSGATTGVRGNGLFTQGISNLKSFTKSIVNRTVSDDVDDVCLESGEKSSQSKSNGFVCSVCIDSFEPGDMARRLPCGHVFHQVCIDPWLTKKSSRCPMCNFNCAYKDPHGRGINETVGSTIDLNTSLDSTHNSIDGLDDEYMATPRHRLASILI